MPNILSSQSREAKKAKKAREKADGRAALEHQNERTAANNIARKEWAEHEERDRVRKANEQWAAVQSSWANQNRELAVFQRPQRPRDTREAQNDRAHRILLEICQLN
jgi:hypothetical protein